jgi:hypothetical protein
MAVLKHFVLNLVKEIPDKASLKTRRKTLGWDDQYLQTQSRGHGNDLQAIALAQAGAA